MTPATTQSEDRSTREIGEARSGQRRLVVTTVVLAIALVALGAWVLYDLTAEPATRAPAEVSQVIDDYLRAWEQQDEGALRASASADFELSEYIYEETPDGVALYEHVIDDLDGIVRVGFLFPWQVEQVGEPVVTGNGPWVVSVEEIWVQNFWRYEGIATYVVVDDGGTVKITNHSWSGLRHATEERAG